MSVFLIQRNRIYYARCVLFGTTPRRERMISLHTRVRSIAEVLLERVKTLYAEALAKGADLSAINLGNFSSLQMVHDEYISDLKRRGISWSYLQMFEFVWSRFQKFVTISDISDLGKNDLLAFLDSFRTENILPVTANKYIGIFRTFLNWCVDCDYLEVIPARIVIHAVRDDRPRYFTDDELNKVYRYATSKHDAELVHFVRMMADTGIRFGEIFLANPAGSFLIVKTSKGGETRAIPADPIVQGFVQHFKEKGAAYCETMCTRFREACRKTRIYDVPLYGVRTLHCLRHTFALKAYLQSRDIYFVKTLLGHREVSTTEIYLKFSLQELKHVFVSFPIPSDFIDSFRSDST
ncbi:MAG: tyrosine-type recombinase/integrase [Phycisphaerae bacterium]|nr:tyrosine-type recombinase/integrase [Phycisphaerae bacterium]